MGRALITGASAGLGLEFAWQLATDRHDLVLVARDEERLAHHAAQLRAAAGVDVEVLPADLADRAEVERVAARLRAGAAPVGLLVNNAGFGLRQRIVGGDLADEERGLDVMVRAVLVLSHAAVNAMVPRGRGAICNVSSVAALSASGTYAAHKAWVRTFTEALAGQLRGTGVTATVVCPGYTRTEFHARAGLRMSWLPEVGFLDAADVVAAGLRDVRRGVVVSTPSVRYKVASAALRVMPRSMVRRVDHRRPVRRAD